MKGKGHTNPPISIRLPRADGCAWGKWFVALCLLWTAAAARASEESGAGESSAVLSGSLFNRVVLIGASATAGMIDPNAGGGADPALFGLRPYLEAALLVPHEPVRSVASQLFFLWPHASATTQLERALNLEPTLLVGLDFLFWFCYGDVPTEEARVRRVNKALELLDGVTCPLVLGDIPDASAAVNGMLRPSQIPRAETLAAVNRGIRQWARARKDTAVVGLATFMQAAARNEPIRIRGLCWEQPKLLLQQDNLHPTARGAAVLAIAVLDQFLSDAGLECDAAIRWDLEPLFLTQLPD